MLLVISALVCKLTIIKLYDKMKITIISGVMLRKGAVKFWRINY